MDIKDLKQHFETKLTPIYDSVEVEAIFFRVLEEVLQLPKIQLLAQSTISIDDWKVQRIENILHELQDNKPLQYILGKTEFYGLQFKVTPSVLIPRQETEELVHWVLQSIPEQVFNKNIHILDIGTGSGCIPISIKKNIPLANVSALDISNDALMIARENARLNQVNIDFIMADILDIQHKELYFAYKHDIVISNPPYITEIEKLDMHPNVLANEPHLALFVRDEKPLLFYEAIANFARNNLKTNGLLFFEMNARFGVEIQNMLLTKGFKTVEIKADMQGKPRMIRAIL